MIKASCANVILLLFLVLQKICVEACCPIAGYTEISGSCYKHYDSLIYTDAQSNCEADGGWLVVITSAAEMSAILSVFSADQPFFIGLTDASSVWAWVNGETFAFTDW